MAEGNGKKATFGLNSAPTFGLLIGIGTILFMARAEMIGIGQRAEDRAERFERDQADRWKEVQEALTAIRVEAGSQKATLAHIAAQIDSTAKKEHVESRLRSVQEQSAAELRALDARIKLLEEEKRRGSGK